MITAHHRNEPTPLYLHAELLPNIRHITLYASLPATVQSQNIQPEICLSGSCRAITISLPPPYDHVTDTLKLPARVNEASRRALSMAGQQAGDAKNQRNGQREYSFRMQIDDEDNSLLSREEHVDSFVPWTAMDMTHCTMLRCRHCKNILLDSRVSCDSNLEAKSIQGWVWKDLPSGNWAEMMDFWHCHKPDPHEGHDHDHTNGIATEDQNATVKGYGALNQVVATPGTVLVDVATFLIADIDCLILDCDPIQCMVWAKKEGGHFITMLWSSIQLPYNHCILVSLLVEKKSAIAASMEAQTDLLCDNCNGLIGIEDTVAKGWRLFKTSVSVNRQLSQGAHEDPAWESHPLEVVVAAQLLELIERESARRFVLHCGQGDGLLIWVFNPDMQYSNSHSDHSINAQRAMKILFQDVTNVDEMLQPDRGKASSLSLEELRLPSGVLSVVLQGSFGNGRLALCIGLTGQRMFKK
ncbi:HECT-type E3 ubiquitin transferase [Aspergillus alliaceus]|uniref:HECT-type E3 ubiquitin transferase n=1 Tax=Petromyces alliaceus TaxID=209559 RepID=UPI0012A678D0|nr:ubiquitin-conjugating enzyme E2-binding protein [Aspergillus alliaceus]KAB8237068.1 ubiquitin-conjugating enzyme E2-binding protein [Aspergillus alliaceus]